MEKADLLGESLDQFRVTSPAEGPVESGAVRKRLKPIDRSQMRWGAIDIEKLIEADTRHGGSGQW